MNISKRNAHQLLVLLPVLLLSFGLHAQDTLSNTDLALLEKAGVPVYPGLKFVNGTLSGMAGLRFATDDELDKVRDWYQQNLPEWTLYDQYGGWILHSGGPGTGMAAVMQKNQVAVTENQYLQDWFGLPPDVTTEVVIALPEMAGGQ